MADGSAFGDEQLWTREHLAEIEEHFIKHPDQGDRSFIEKFRAQLAPASAGAKRLAAEMLWVMLLFPNNVGRQSKVETIRTIWGWSGTTLPDTHPLLLALGQGVGSGGMGFNTYRPFELTLFVRLMQAWKGLPADEKRLLIDDPWLFAEFVDGIEGADRRQFRHMLLHLLFPDTFERVSSGDNKTRIDSAFRDRLDGQQLPPNETATSLIARDRRLLHVRRLLEAEPHDGHVDFYEGRYAAHWQPPAAGPVPPPPLPQPAPPRPTAGTPPTQAVREPSREYAQPDLASIAESIRSLNLRIDDRTIRRYHLALASRGFVILSGVSGTGKTWLAEAYAQAIGARTLVVPVAPNWTTNEDLLGFVDPFSGAYRDTPFSRFLREASAAHTDARRDGRHPRPFHLILDEMNLARVEYYFARFLSAMELRMRAGEAQVELGPNDNVTLPPNLFFIGTVNVDETTHGFADKVYDRAQLIEVPASREALAEHLGAAPYRDLVLELWDAVHPVAPFAFRVLDDIGRYIEKGSPLGVQWEEMMDELLLQKILPKIRGTDPRVGDALQTVIRITDERFPLSNAKARAMRASYEQHGVASFF